MTAANAVAAAERLLADPLVILGGSVDDAARERLSALALAVAHALEDVPAPETGKPPEVFRLLGAVAELQQGWQTWPRVIREDARDRLRCVAAAVRASLPEPSRSAPRVVTHANFKHLRRGNWVPYFKGLDLRPTDIIETSRAIEACYRAFGGELRTTTLIGLLKELRTERTHRLTVAQIQGLPRDTKALR